MLNDQDDRLVKDSSQLFIGNENRTWFDVRNRMGPAVLVDGNLGFEEEGQLSGAHKRIFVIGHCIRQNSTNCITVKNVFLGGRGGVLLGVEDAANGGSKEITQLSLLAEFLVAIAVATVVGL